MVCVTISFLGVSPLLAVLVLKQELSDEPRYYFYPTIRQDVFQIHWIFVTYPFLFSVLNLFLILCPQLQYTES